MKKISYLLFVLLLGIVMIPKVFAEDLVSIESIEMVEKSDNTVINNEPTFDGLDMNYDVSFSEVGDFIKYKITVKNNTDTDYKISERTLFNDSEYVKYVYEVDDILAANSSVVVNLTISYNKEIDNSDFVNGKYVESNKATVKLLNDDGQEVNPNTGSSYKVFIILGVSLLVLLVSALAIKNEKLIRGSSILLVIGLVAVPFIVRAIEEIELKANVKVEITKYYTVTYSYTYSQVLRENEIASSGFGEDSCVPYYLNEYTQDNKYYQCSKSMLETDQQKYAYGDLVEIRTIPISYVNKEVCQRLYDYDNGYYWLCPDEAFIDNTVSVSYQWPSYLYDSDNHFDYEAAEELYPSLEMKDENGNPVDYYDFFGVGAGYTFRMLDYDVSLFIPVQ